MKADGQDVLVYVADAISFIYVFGGWTISIFILLFLIKTFRRKDFAKKQKLIIWTVGLCFAFFHWTMVKYDPFPYSGPIDSIVKKDRIEKSRVNHSLELINGKADSTIEYVYSVDTLQQGVYMWLDKKMQRIRPLTNDEKNGGQMNDELTRETIEQRKK